MESQKFILQDVLSGNFLCGDNGQSRWSPFAKDASCFTTREAALQVSLHFVGTRIGTLTGDESCYRAEDRDTMKGFISHIASNPLILTCLSVLLLIGCGLQQKSASVTPPPAGVATPSISPASGAVAIGQAVAITDSTANSTIYFTTDGSTPNASSPIYASPLPLNTAGTLTVQAMAAANGSTSTTATANYDVTASTNPSGFVSINHFPAGTPVVLNPIAGDEIVLLVLAQGAPPTIGTSTSGESVACIGNEFQGNLGAAGFAFNAVGGSTTVSFGTSVDVYAMEYANATGIDFAVVDAAQTSVPVGSNLRQFGVSTHYANEIVVGMMGFSGLAVAAGNGTTSRLAATDNGFGLCFEDAVQPVAGGTDLAFFLTPATTGGPYVEFGFTLIPSN